MVTSHSIINLQCIKFQAGQSDLKRDLGAFIRRCAGLKGERGFENLYMGSIMMR